MKASSESGLWAMRTVVVLGFVIIGGGGYQKVAPSKEVTPLGVSQGKSLAQLLKHQAPGGNYDENHDPETTRQGVHARSASRRLSLPLLVHLGALRASPRPRP